MTARIIYAAVNMSQNLSLETQSTGIRRKKTKTAAQEIGPYRIPPDIFGIVLAARFRCGFCQNRDVFVSPFCLDFFLLRKTTRIGEIRSASAFAVMFVGEREL